MPQGIAITGETSSSDIGQYMLPGGAWTTLPSVSLTSALLLPSTASLRLMAGAFPGTATITFQGWDETQGLAGKTYDIAASGGATAFSTASATLSLAIKSAPRWTATAGADLTPLAPGTYSTTNTSTPAANTISSVFGSFFEDANQGVNVGVAIVGVTGNGAWQYSTNNGFTWTNFPVVSATSALLLESFDDVRFVPKTSAAGTATLVARAWDGSIGTIGKAVNPGVGGGVSAFSAATLTATRRRQPRAEHRSSATLNEAAIAAGATSSAITVATLLAPTNYTDPDGTTLPRGIAIIGAASTVGTVQYMLVGGSWQALPSVSATAALLLPSTASVRFMTNGSLGAATLTFEGWDQTQGAAGQVFDITATGGATAFSTQSSVVTFTVKQARKSGPPPRGPP